jgi:hypothetical protein
VIWTGALSFAGIVNYQGTITLNPASSDITESLMIRYVAPANETDRLDLNFNKDLILSTLSCPRCFNHVEGQVDKRTQTRRTAITFRPALRAGETIDILFRAGGKLIDTSSDTNSFSPRWVELSVDSGWYPYEAEDRNFVFDLQMKIDPSYKLVGNAKIYGGDGHWRLRTKVPVSDIDFAAARGWTSKIVKTHGLSIKIISVDVPSPTLQTFAQQAASAARTFTEWFGKAVVHDLTVVLNPRQDGSSYSRPGYVSLAYSPQAVDQKHLLFILTHEVAHFWWSRASGGTWENWLNEAFAEYSALMYVRQSEGIEAFNTMMLQHALRSKEQPPIWGVSRSMGNYATVIYSKGALRLQQLEEMLGREKFRQLLATTARKQVRTTQDFLNELQTESTIEIRLKFEQLLKS